MNWASHQRYATCNLAIISRHYWTAAGQHHPNTIQHVSRQLILILKPRFTNTSSIPSQRVEIGSSPTGERSGSQSVGIVAARTIHQSGNAVEHVTGAKIFYSSCCIPILFSSPIYVLFSPCGEKTETNRWPSEIRIRNASDDAVLG